MKSALASKTLWFNIVTAALYLVSGPLGIAIPADIALYINAGGNFILRFLTTKAIV